MSVRRRNENDVAYRRPIVSTLKKVNTDQNTKDAQGRPTVRDKPAPIASKPETSESKGIKDDSKLGGARRQALSSLTNGMASSRQPLAAKPLGPTRPLVEATSKIRGKTAPSRTPAKARPTKKLNIYTPARSTVMADMDEVNHLHDEIEYMPPTAIERPYEPPPIRRNCADDDLFETSQPDSNFSFEPTPFEPVPIGSRKPQSCAETETSPDDLVFDP